MNSMKSSTTLGCVSLRLVKYTLWKSAGRSLMRKQTTSWKAETKKEYQKSAILSLLEVTSEHIVISSAYSRRRFMLSKGRSFVIDESVGEEEL